jgi:signal transduction histidine kinase
VQQLTINPKLKSIRGRLFLLVAALAVPTLAIISALSWEAYRSQQRAVRSELANTARAVASLVDAELDRSLAMLQTLAGARSLRDEDWGTLDSTARRVIQTDRRWLVVVDLDGRQLINTRLPRGTPVPAIELDPAYVAAMRAGQTFVSDLVFGPVANGLVVHVGIPVMHSSGRVYGLSMVMLPQGIGESLDVGRFAPDGVLSVLDRGGRIIARNPHQTQFMGKSATPDLVKAILERTEGVGESVTLEQIPVLNAFSRARCGWTVAIGTPKAKVVSSTRRLILIGAGSSLAVTLAAIALALAIARAVVRSVEGLTEDAESLARGEVPAWRANDLQETNFVAQALRRLAETKSAAEQDLREARDRLREYAQELEKKVEERTVSLREAVSQMEEFSYTISHDLRSPLRAITGYASVLLEDYAPSLDETSRDYLRRIVRATERMDRLTTDLLSYSRVAKTELQRERIPLESMFRNVIEHYSELHPTVADITLRVPFHDVLAHEPSLTQVLANLLTNAAKFVRHGERPIITVRTEKRDDRVRIWVEDNGIGIEPNHQKRLFQIFERAPTNGTYTGTGVGLAIVRKIVEKMGGACGVESDGKSGSRFWIELSAAA